MYGTKRVFFYAFLLPGISSYAQHSKIEISDSFKITGHATKSVEFVSQLQETFTPVSVDLNWLPSLTSKTIEHKVENNYLIDSIKTSKLLSKSNYQFQSLEEKSTSSITPVIGTNFQGVYAGVLNPPDNSIAISNGGHIIGVDNKNISFYNTIGTLLYTNTLVNFVNLAGATAFCDPVVLYDTQADKFIFFVQQSSGPHANRKIVICFSQTNDPNGAWNKYIITGDPFNTGSWFDFPRMAISNNELYISGNTFSNTNMSFTGAVLYQMQKSSGFSGGNLVWQAWNNFSGNPSTLLPVSYGLQGGYGPGCYFVSIASAGGSNINLYNLTDDLSASNEQINHYSISTPSYSVPANASQQGTAEKLDVSSCKALSGFYVNGIIHFVFHSDYGGGFNSINYNRLNVSLQTNTSSRLGLSGYDYAFPSVVPFTTSATDKSVMIGFLRSGVNIYPEMRVVNCDDNMNWGPSVQVKAGEGYVDMSGAGAGVTQWGDYIGMSRKHNSSYPSVWMIGMYGTTYGYRWHEWVAEINPFTVIDNSTEKESKKLDQFKIAPNPIYQDFTTEFNMNASENVSIDIYDAQGKLVKHLFSGMCHVGENVFSFNSANLSNGLYFISVSSSNNKMLKREKIIISN